ncbi:bifunctional serine/threonine-protein kinase/universal stress protein [Rhodoplanes sp. TEM]|uniref:Bifunctional serine/threonine-protein kinase/universal stress protein n=1 Tax=Rhodoplanes tepidamans TaxID=200616 RepID=A0ABT5J6U0_RHOTP|nr:bifunctional serine/threonine-protein kinase/universal stress protein [Rhodoplanes tepidamans]MDC7984326.1 bifunctional serine/threonine-protein kinase/universal stress protein [Rhodoplanes sp. TEM]
MRSLSAGQVIDGFKLEQQLDPGGMADFWRVSREGDTLPLIMKIPLLRRGEDPLTIVGFEQEQMILARLSGPHVPRFVASGDFERPYIVMEHVAGRPLKTLLAETPLPATQVASIGAAIAEALYSIHRQHVTHLDLKPSNIILRDDGSAVLIDFGLSRHDQLPDLIAEEFDEPVGTGAYVAPEQVRRFRGDPRSDIFSLGVTMYFLATGERPYGEPEREAEWRRRLWRDPFPPTRWNPLVPPWLQEIILRCLEIDRDARYASAAQLRFDLQHPDGVALTERAARRDRDGPLTVLSRWLKVRNAPPLRMRSIAGVIDRSPIVMAAVDLGAADDLGDAIAAALRRVLATVPDARLACVNVLKTSRIALDPLEDAHGRNPHLQRLVELKHWARPLPVDGDRITYHVFESPDPAAAIVEYARNNNVDHIVMGARGSSSLRRYLGSVSAQVVAQAPCTVTVVRRSVAAGDTPAEGEAQPAAQ